MEIAGPYEPVLGKFKPAGGALSNSIHRLSSGQRAAVAVSSVMREWI